MEGRTVAAIPDNGILADTKLSGSLEAAVSHMRNPCVEVFGTHCHDLPFVVISWSGREPKPPTILLSLRGVDQYGDRYCQLGDLKN